jgi:hypothetical protein
MATLPFVAVAVFDAAASGVVLVLCVAACDTAGDASGDRVPLGVKLPFTLGGASDAGTVADVDPAAVMEADTVVPRLRLGLAKGDELATADGEAAMEKLGLANGDELVDVDGEETKVGVPVAVGDKEGVWDSEGVGGSDGVGDSVGVGVGGICTSMSPKLVELPGDVNP